MTFLLRRSLVRAAGGGRRFLSDAPPTTSPTPPAPAPAPAPASSSDFSETLRDVAGFLVLSIASGAFLLNEVKDLGVPQKKKKKKGGDDDD